MTRYDAVEAGSYRVAREISIEGLSSWRDAVAPYFVPGRTVLDLGAGTGLFVRAFTEWFPDVSVVAVEPSADMRSASGLPMLTGDACAIPVPDASVDVVWMSTVVHHVRDLAAAGVELRRVLRPGGVVVLRSLFRERHGGIGLFRFFPEAVRALSGFPTVTEVADGMGFAVRRLEAVPQVTAVSLADKASTLRQEADTLLRSLSAEEFERGRKRLLTAAAVETGPVVDHLDLLVLRTVGAV
ncbi:class I SAM-dependent methyltransferase [Lentzea sp. BCCO 10_0061]|uniref:Class I SAM-dependent methyltransferase n=1 Tax=Lentzea sokolovensis TaxID=3095429 RepID=A0ABU4V9V7_9PSEU|nr:class I SAM-dependent methyltransferase [Lentzea sp. BCCO 10_0061]MDX8148583.1 class I SAM-dependent methyltransferase [Lentzea sp. BCCO 10_0061]